MIHAFVRTKLSLASSCAVCVLALAAVSVPSTAGAQASSANAKSADTGYLLGPANSVTKSGYGLCWQAGATAPASTAECDPNFVPPAAKVEPAPPRPVAPAPPPVEVAKVESAPPQPVIEKVTLDADALFDFNKAELRPEGRATIDKFVLQLQGVDTKEITAIGHTDRIGSPGYNQRLSEKRAEAVRTYLISKGIEPNRVHAEGKGESQPITKTGECDRVKTKLIACLQPDRRVVVEVVGTRTITK